MLNIYQKLGAQGNFQKKGWARRPILLISYIEFHPS